MCGDDLDKNALYLFNDADGLKVKGWTKINHANFNQKKTVNLG